MVRPITRWKDESSVTVVGPAPDWMYSKGGDRELAERLLFEHGMDHDFKANLDPKVIEIMAATGQLTNIADVVECGTCGAKHDEPCDAGLHS